MTAARLAGPRDLLVASAGPGYFSTVAALSKEARRAGARVLILTSQPLGAAAAELGDVVLQLPACCLPASDATAAGQASEAPPGQPSPLLMGSSYELALQLFFDLVCVLLPRELGLATEDMVQRHTNLE